MITAILAVVKTQMQKESMQKMLLKQPRRPKENWAWKMKIQSLEPMLLSKIQVRSGGGEGEGEISFSIICLFFRGKEGG